MNLYKNHLIVRIICKIVIAFLVLFIAAILFLKLWPAFGKKPSKEQKKEYEARADNYKDAIFSNEEEFSVMSKGEEAKNVVVSTKGKRPQEELPQKEPSYKKNPEKTEFNVTWFGHSSLLIQMHGMNILVDPVFSEYSSPVQFAGPKRYSTPKVTIEQLPHIDVLLLSHDHYDHLDYNTIKKLESKVDQYVVPLGVENHLQRWGVKEDKITNMAWWESIEVEGLTIDCTPSQHFSGRSLDDQYNTLWASWVLKDEYYQIFESGDTGFGQHFQEIHEKYGDFDFVMLDCAQYDQAWAKVHMTPEESYEAAGILGTKVVMPIHWGAFVLANHAWDDPVSRYVRAAKGKEIQVVTPMLGETMELSHYEDYKTPWWEDIK